MRGYFVLPVLLGLTLLAPAVRADRRHHDRPAREMLSHERHALERIRTADEARPSFQRSAASSSERTTRGAIRRDSAQGRQLLGRFNPSSHARCNEADECTMSRADAKSVIDKAAARNSGGGSFVNTIRDRIVSKNTMSPVAKVLKMSEHAASNQADESYMGTQSAQMIIDQAGRASRSQGGSYVNAIRDRIVSKNMMTPVAHALKMSEHAASNEADESYMGTQSAQMIIDQAARH
jgi:hypothetical protein